MANGVFDDFLYDAISRRRSLAGARCWDIGAHVGYHTLAFANQGADVLTFEPAKANVDRLNIHLQRNNTLSGHIRLIPSAVANIDGELLFVESDDMQGASTGSHLVNATPPLDPAAYSEFRENAVHAVTIDTLIEKRGELPPDIIKIDVEGAENLVIEGGRRLLETHKPMLLVEVHHICVMFSFVQTLRELGYQLEVLDAAHATPSRCFVSAF